MDRGLNLLTISYLRLPSRRCVAVVSTILIHDSSLMICWRFFTFFQLRFYMVLMLYAKIFESWFYFEKIRSQCILLQITGFMVMSIISSVFATISFLLCIFAAVQLDNTNEAGLLFPHVSKHRNIGMMGAVYPMRLSEGKGALVLWKCNIEISHLSSFWRNMFY